MKYRFIITIFMMSLTPAMVFSEEPSSGSRSISYDYYIEAVEKALPEIKGNEMNVLSAENKITGAKSNGDISVNAGGSAYSNKDYSRITGKGDIRGYDYYAGLSKTITSTGTTVSGTYNYTKNSYSGYTTSPDFSSYAPSYTVKVAQPLLYNFLGKVDSYAENDAEMKHEIAKIQLQENNKSVLNAYKKLYFQWIMYRENIKNLDNAIWNSNILKERIRKKVSAGLADDDDYQGAVTSVLNYTNQRREHLTLLKNTENQIYLYLDIKSAAPDEKFFDDIYVKSSTSDLSEIDFAKTASARIMDLTMKNYAYSKGVYENRLLPQLNVYAGMTKKDFSETRTYGAKDTDYNVGFEFRYSLENNAAESSLKDIEIQIKSLQYSYKSTENAYKKQLLVYIESSNGIIEQLQTKEKTLEAMESKLVTEKRKYNQARLNLSYVIDTENSITAEKNNILALKYRLIGNYIDYMDLVKQESKK